MVGLARGDHGHLQRGVAAAVVAVQVGVEDAVQRAALQRVAHQRNRLLGSTLLLGAEVTALCLVLGFPLAWLYHRVGSRLQTLIILIVLLPLLTSVVVRTFAWIVILGRQGIVNATLQSMGAIETPLRLLYTQFGVVVALAQVQMPLMTLPLITALGRIDMNLEDASCSLGAGSWRTFRKVRQLPAP
eukprot:gene46190-62573_t